MQQEIRTAPDKTRTADASSHRPGKTDSDGSTLERIRRLDWRFLLPDPRLGSVGFLGRPGSPLHRALNEFSDNLTSLSKSDQGQHAPDIEVLVVESADLEELPQAAARVMAGGHIYLEWRRRGRLDSPLNTVKKLRTAGFCGFELHWHRPGFGSCLDIVPIQDKMALRHVFSRNTSSLKGKFQELAGRILAQLNLAGFLFSNVSIVAKKSGSDKGGPREIACRDSVSEFLASRSGEQGIVQIPHAEDLISVFVTPRFKASAHVIVFMLSKRTGETVLVAKVPRIAGHDDRLQDEVANLGQVQSLTPNGFPSVPRVVAFEKFQGYRLLIETAVPGQTMRPSFVRRNRELCLKKGLAWIAELHLASRRESSGQGGDLAISLAKTMSHLKPLADRGDVNRDLLADTQRQIDLLASAHLPLVFEHGDYSSPNILISDDLGIGVVDWELAESAGLPAVDLFFFQSYIAFADVNAGTLQEHLLAFQKAFFGESAWAYPYVREYCSTIDLEPRLLRPLFVVCWSRYVATLMARLRAPGSELLSLDDKTLNWLQENRYYQMWRYSLENLDELNLCG